MGHLHWPPARGVELWNQEPSLLERGQAPATGVQGPCWRSSRDPALHLLTRASVPITIQHPQQGTHNPDSGNRASARNCDEYAGNTEWLDSHAVTQRVTIRSLNVTVFSE